MGVQLEGAVHHSREGSGCRSLQSHLSLVTRQGDERWSSAGFPPFVQSKTPAHGMMPPKFKIIFIPQLKQSEAPSHLCSEAYLQLAVLTIIPPRFKSCRGWLGLFGEEAVFNCSVVFSSRNSGTLLAISISLYQTNSPNLRSNSFFQFPRSNLNPLHDSCLMSMTHKDV